MPKPKKKMKTKSKSKKQPKRSSASKAKPKRKPAPKPKARPKAKPRAKPRATAEAPAEFNPFRQLAIAAARAADEKMALEILVLDLGKTSDVADFVVIAGAESSAQMGAIETQIEEDLRALGHRPIRREGSARDRRWIAVDYGNLLVHVLMPQARELYRLDQLWENAKQVKWAKAK